MINKLVPYLSNKLSIKNKELLEKDILLHLLLINLEKNINFNKNYSFKGGTCLIKCYLGYYRFSEDLDFSYIYPEEFKNKSEKQIRKELSIIITNLSKLLMKISEKLKFDFSIDKTNKKYYEFGSNNKFIKFKLWYTSITNNQQFIKIQINFIEKFYYKFKIIQVENMIKKINYKEFNFLFPEYIELLNYPKIKVYDIKEILLEKNRVIITRKALKARDFIDVFLILEYLKQEISIYRTQILEKTRFMINKYTKYKDNLNVRKKLGFKYILGEESKLLIKEIDLIELNKFNKKQILFLQEIIKELY
jgi:predicted nucleotidyltransferase component of viral defense system